MLRNYLYLSKIVTIMGRELRKVPANWEHPKNEHGNYIAQYNEFYGDALNAWIEENKQWEEGTHPDLIKDPTLKEKFPFLALYDAAPPDVESYQVKKYSPEELTHIQLYETTSEGTPISPIFRADQLDDLCAWAAKYSTTFADFKATKEQWLKMLTSNSVSHTEGNATFL